MSLTQTLIVLFIGMLLMEPNDIFKVIKKIKNIKTYLVNTDNQIDELSTSEQLNFYIQKIINIEGYYDGDYNLTVVKEKYNKLIKSVIDSDLINIT